MLALRSFAKSTLGELKDSLLEADSDGEDDEDENPKPPGFNPAPAAANCPPGEPAPWPPGWPDTGVAGGAVAAPGATSSTATFSRAASSASAAPPPLDQGAREHAADEADVRAAAAADSEAVPETAAAAAAETGRADQAQANDGPRSGEIPAAADALVAELQAEAVGTAAGVGAGGDDDRQNLLASFSERYDTLLAQYAALQRRCREMSENQGNADVLAQQVDAWRSAQQVAQERVETLTLENSDLKERLRAFERRSVDPDEKKQLLLRLQQREAEVKAASEALQELSDVIEDGAGSDKTRCAALQAELVASRQAAAEVQAALTAAVENARLALEAADAAKAREEAMAARCSAIEKDSAETALALEALLRQKERYMEEQPNLVDKRLVTCMLANYLDHFESGQRPLADAALAQMLHILGGLPDLEVRQRIRGSASPKEPLGQAFLQFLDNEIGDELPAGDGAANSATAQ